MTERDRFIDLYNVGILDADDIDDAIDGWHDGPNEGRELHEYLGLTFEQYKKWVEKSELPPPTGPLRDQCFMCSERNCFIRIYRPGVMDEVACHDHIKDLEHHADLTTKEIKSHLSSTSKLRRGDSMNDNWFKDLLRLT